jgi:chromosome segregation ATPase
MTTDVTTRLNSLKSEIENGKAQKAKAEANLETYTKQLDDVKAEISALGVEPTIPALEAEIAKLDAEILGGLDQAEQLLRAPDKVAGQNA